MLIYANRPETLVSAGVCMYSADALFTLNILNWRRSAGQPDTVELHQPMDKYAFGPTSLNPGYGQSVGRSRTPPTHGLVGCPP
jgi:hypothetical protein